ncbi:MAG: hypothetical protein ACJA0N_001346 [Pseudohongiellaceae bacterium]|jgi:hypothetical protein
MSLTKILLSVFSVVVVLLSGCSTIVSGDKEQLTIDSLPRGAMVKMDGIDVGVTPLTLSVSRKKANIELVKEGFDSQFVTLTKEINPMFFGNLIIGGLFGSSTDTATGAIHRYNPGQYMVTLKAASESSAEPAAEQVGQAEKPAVEKSEIPATEKPDAEQAETPATEKPTE